MAEIKTVGTSCEKCVFRINDDSGKQVGCSFGRLELLGMKKNGDNNFYNGSRYCSLYRPEQWARNVDGELELKAKAYGEIITTFRVYITSKGNIDLVALDKTLSSLSNQILVPTTVSVIIPQEDAVDISSLIDLIEKFDTLKWTIEQPIDEMGELLLPYKSEEQYFVYVESGKELPEDYFAAIDNAINFECQQILGVRETEFCGRCIQQLMYKNLEHLSDEKMSMMLSDSERLEYIFKESSFIRDYEDLVLQ